MSGLFITFEGIEGCGKTTQIQLLAPHLRDRGLEVVITREPGGVPVAEAIRALLLDPANDGLSPMSELLLYAAARAQHVHEIIRPSLDRGAVVLCDRFADSTTAYQGGGRGLSEQAIYALHGFATEGAWPDATLLFDLPVAEGLRRSLERGVLDRIEGEPTDFHERVRTAFLALAAQDPERITIIDAARPVEAVAQCVRACVDALLAGL